MPQASPLPLPEVAACLAPFRSLFRYRQSWESLERYVTGLLTNLPRKNCDVLAATVANTSVERLQHLLTKSRIREAPGNNMPIRTGCHRGVGG